MGEEHLRSTGSPKSHKPTEPVSRNRPLHFIDEGTEAPRGWRRKELRLNGFFDSSIFGARWNDSNTIPIQWGQQDTMVISVLGQGKWAYILLSQSRTRYLGSSPVLLHTHPSSSLFTHQARLSLNLCLVPKKISHVLDIS